MIIRIFTFDFSSPSSGSPPSLVDGAGALGLEAPGDEDASAATLVGQVQLHAIDTSEGSTARSTAFER